MTSASQLVHAIATGDFTTRELVRMEQALKRRLVNTSALADYGEWLCAQVVGGTVVTNFSTKAYDVTDAAGLTYQVKTHSVGRKPGVLRSFAMDFYVRLEVDDDAVVIRAWHVPAAVLRELHEPLRPGYEAKGWFLNQRGWTPSRAVYIDPRVVDMSDAYRLVSTRPETSPPATG